MLTRRTLIVCTALTGFALAAGPGAWLSPARAQGGGDATGFVVKLGSELVGVIDGPGTYEEKKRRLQPVIERAVDVEGIGRFSLGRFWRTATPEQQVQFSRLFHDVLLNNIFGKIGEFQGVTFTPTTTTQREADTLVGTLIRRPNQQPNNVQWVVNSINGGLKIVDVVAEGTSLRLTQRSDYAAYLARNNNNVDALIAAMKQQIAR